MYKRMYKKKSIAIGFLIILAMCFTLLVGCSPQTETSGEGVDKLADKGTIILRVNPEISVHYNKEGLVTKLAGLNDDGDVIVSGYDDYIGKNVRDVVRDLVGKINDAGYFVSDIDGEYRNITIQIEPGSVLPQSDFMEVLADDVQTTVKTMNLNSKILGIGPDDYEKVSSNNNASNDTDRSDAQKNQAASSQKSVQSISKDKAKEIALLHAGLKASDVTFVKVERDYDDGRLEYEVEFYKDDYEYEYEIDAATGKIISVEHEFDDDDDRYYHERKDSSKSTSSTSSGSSPSYISMDRAVEIALAHAGAAHADAVFDDKEFDIDDGRALYELEFEARGMEYEYDIDAVTGKIISYEWDD